MVGYRAEPCISRKVEGEQYIKTRRYKTSLKFGYSWRSDRYFGRMMPCDVCDGEESRKSCKCHLHTHMIPGFKVSEVTLSSPTDLNLSFMAGDQRVPACYGSNDCNTKIPIHTYGRAGKIE